MKLVTTESHKQIVSMSSCIAFNTSYRFHYFCFRSSVNCNFFLLPCCPWDFTAKFSTKKSGMSVYQNYLNYVTDVIDVCGFCVEKDTLRIPSTKRVNDTDVLAVLCYLSVLLISPRR